MAAFDAVNADKVDGLHAVKSNATATQRKGKLVATSPTTGKLPTSIMNTSPNSLKLGGQTPAAFVLDSELMTLLLGLDGSSSGLDADTIDGFGSDAFATSSHNHDGSYSAIGHDHDASYPTRAELSSPGVLNDAGNPVDWSKLKNVPAGIADGDDTSSTATDVNCSIACISSAEIVNGTIDVVDLFFDPATQTELNAVSTSVNNVQTQLNTLTSSLSTPGAINAGGNPVDWSKLKSVPAGFADGTDADTTQTAGAGLSLSSNQFSVNFAGTGAATTVARSDHTHASSATPVAFASGDGPDLTTTNAFVSPTVSVTITAGQKIVVDATQSFGSLATPGTGLDLYICYNQGSLTTVGGGIFGLTMPANNRMPFTMNAAITGLAPGTYLVGMCGKALNPANWTNGEWGYVTAMVLS